MDNTLNIRRVSLRANIEMVWLKVDLLPPGMLMARLYGYLLHGDSSSCENNAFWMDVAEAKDDHRKVSYACAGEGDRPGNRRVSSMAKFLRGPARKRGCTFTDAEIEEIATVLGEWLPRDDRYTWRVIDGLPIYDAYQNTDCGRGSCMTGEKMVRWYSDNPASVSMLCCDVDGSLFARALLWTAETGERVLDRVYPADGGPHVAAMHRYAVHMGWDYRVNQYCGSANLASGRTDLTVRMKPSKHEYPYVDSFRFTAQDPADKQDLILTLRDDVSAYTFCETDGSYHGDDQVICCHGDCLNSASEEYCTSNGNLYCRHCFYAYYREVDYYIGEDRFYGTEDAALVFDCADCGASRLRRHGMVANDACYCRECFARLSSGERRVFDEEGEVAIFPSPSSPPSIAATVSYAMTNGAHAELSRISQPVTAAVSFVFGGTRTAE